MTERCPDIKAPLRLWDRSGAEENLEKVSGCQTSKVTKSSVPTALTSFALDPA